MSNALAVDSVRDRFARVISDIFSPPMLALPALLLAAGTSNEPGVYGDAAIYFLLAVVPPVLYVVWLVKTGRVSDFHLADRRERRGPFIATIVCGLATDACLIALHAPRSLLAPIVVLQALITVLFLISLVWQISVHTATTAGLVAFACLALGPIAAALAWLIPLVGWARIQLGRHTLSQVCAGAAIGGSFFFVLDLVHGLFW